MPSPSLLGQFQGLLVGAALGEPPPAFLDALADWLTTYDTQPLHTQPLHTQPLRNQPLRNQPLRNQPLRNQPLRNQPHSHQVKALVLPWLTPWQSPPSQSSPSQSSPSQSSPSQSLPSLLQDSIAHTSPAGPELPELPDLWEMGLGLSEAIAALFTDALLTDTIASPTASNSLAAAGWNPTQPQLRLRGLWPSLEPLLLERPVFQSSLRTLQTHLLQRSLLGPALQSITTEPRLHLLEQAFYLSYYALFSTPGNASLTLSRVGAGFDQFLAPLALNCTETTHAMALPTALPALPMARCFAITLASAALGARLGLASIPLVDQQHLADRRPQLLAQGQRAWEHWAGCLPDRTD
jgi:hypothetical protein